MAIDLKPRSKGIIKRPVIVENKATLGPYESALITVSYIVLPSDRDFLFEPQTDNIALYTQLVSHNFTAIVGKNDTDQIINLPYKHRLRTVTEIDYNNCYLVIDNISNLALLVSRAESDNAWYNKELNITKKSVTVV